MLDLALNESLKFAIEISQSLAKEYHNEYFYPAHLLRGLLHKEVGLKTFLESIGQDTGFIMEWAEVRMEDYPKTAKIKDNITGDSTVKAVFEQADMIRIKLGLDLINPLCVLAAISKPGVAFNSEQLKSFPVVEKDLLSNFVSQENIQTAVNGPEAETAAAKPGAGALFKYCVERTALAREDKTDPIIGRDKEIRMMMEILCRRTKPNVVITGEAGVGKTALIDGLAMDIVNNKVPGLLANSLIFELDLGSLIAGASYKGEIEDRIKNILKEIKQFDKAILFIDEIHTLLDSKGSIGGGVANLLKPELARGAITVIGATTNDEYRKFIEPDQAFTRRFEVLNVPEPSIESAVKMLDRLASKFEVHHKITIDKNAIVECVRLSKRYIKDRRLPDAAIDILDRTMAAIKLMVDTNEKNLTELKEDLDKLKADETFTGSEKFNEYRWLNSLLQNKISPVLLGKLEDSSQTDKFETFEEFDLYLTGSISKLFEISTDKKNDVNKDDIAAVVSYKTGIPLGKIQAQEKEKLLNMGEHLKKKVIGQDHAVKLLSESILESRSGLNKQGQPIGSFFFMGPTGTGKTELAKSLADFLFNDEKAMTRFDMSEFKEEHSAALLYGAPPGYVGYEEGGMLVNKIRQKPYSVLLFDEVEKAHTSVFDTFLQILDEGHMHDRLGKEGDFSNSLIIFTSNIGSEWIAEQFDKGEIPSSNKLMEIMTKYFRPEFLARLTEIVPFAPISEKSIVRIFEIQMKGLLESLDKQGIKLEITDNAKQFLSLNGFTPKYGARQISTVIRNQLRRPISRYIISGELKKGNTVQINLDNEELTWKIV
ncbi:MAG TPA: ATP-dependent Clp protease ATP-binding subunit [Mucilaginibacter sp.]|nr:ATP-dependent Clp protease ATP-binding subunit [Mucilaginibacter sp.]